MTSERIQRRIEAWLDEADQAASSLDWSVVKDRATAVLAADPGNVDGKAYLEMAERGLVASGADPALPTTPATQPPSTEQPTAFAGGRYSVTRFLGEGGKKRVYLAHDAQLDRDVAFALIKTEGLDEAARVRITREAQAMGRLGSHPHIVTVYDIGEENGQPYLVLPVLPGGDVEGIIEDALDHKLPIAQAVKIASETCLGLEFSHAKGIIHRDLKPGNVWLAEDGRAMIGDFGLAVAVDRSRLTQAGMMVGTVNYMPPEQAMGGEVTPQSDLYSLGAMLYEMVCGRPPFVGDESVAIIGQHLNTPPVAPSWHRPDCPPGLEALILRLLEKDPGKRPGSATEVREALDAVKTTTGSEPSLQQPVEQRGADPLYRRVFVGREQELRQLQQAYDAAVSGQGGLVMVVGEPGIGKTAICEQLATYAAMRGGRWLVGHCYEEGSLSLPYLAFVEAMRTYVLARDPDDLKSDLGTGAAEVARIVSEVRDRLQVEPRGASAPEDDRWRLLTAIATFLTNASSVQPLVIILEDLHWADRGTLDLLLHVARNLAGARLLIVGTYRDVEVDRMHPLSSTVAELRRLDNFMRVPLRGLTVDEVHRMYEAIRGNDVPWGQAEAVHRQTEGSPLFVQEVLRYLVEEGLVVREGGRYVAQQPGEGIPEGLRDVVGRRLSSLGEKANEVLTVASVIGRDFGLDVLQAVDGSSEEELYSALEEAQERAIIEPRETSGAVGFRFTHAFFRQTLYEEIFTPRRIRLHQQVGRALEEVYSRRLEEHAAELAEHFSQSTETSDLEKAVHYADQAARRAMNVYAFGEAVRHLEQALRAQDVLDPDDKLKRCELLLKLGDAQLPLGEPRSVIDSIAAPAYALAESLSDQELAARACVLVHDSLVRVMTGPGAYTSAESQDWARRLASHAPPGSAYEAQAAVLTSLADGLYANPQGLNAALELARQVGDPAVLLFCAWIKAAADMTLTRWQEAVAVIRETSELRELVNSRTRSMFVQYEGSASLLEGDRGGFFAAGEELSLIADRTGDANISQSARANEALRLILDGRIEEAYEVSVAALEAARVLRVYSIAPELSGFSAALYIGKEQEFSERVRPEESVVLLSPYLEAFANGEAHAGVSARDTVAARSPDSLAGACLYLTLAAKRGEFQTVREVLDDLDRSEAAFSLPITIWSLSRLAGDGAIVLGDFARARGFYERAGRECQGVRHRPELALSRLALAELLLDHYPAEHDAAIEHLDFAIAEFRDMKMQPALERALGRRGLLKA